jgi:hypothetical protein
MGAPKKYAGANDACTTGCYGAAACWCPRPFGCSCLPKGNDRTDFAGDARSCCAADTTCGIYACPI